MIEIWCWYMRLLGDILCSGGVNAPNRLMGHTMKRGRSSNEFHRTEKLRRISTRKPWACCGKTIRPEEGDFGFIVYQALLFTTERWWIMAALRCEPASKAPATDGHSKHMVSIIHTLALLLGVAKRHLDAMPIRGWRAGRRPRYLREE